MKFIKDWKSNRRRILEYKWSINFLIVKRKNVNEIKTQVIRMFVCLNNGGTLSIIGVIMKAIDDSKIRSAPLVTGLLQYWVFIIFIWMLDCFSNSDIDRSVLRDDRGVLNHNLMSASVIFLESLLVQCLYSASQVR